MASHETMFSGSNLETMVLTITALIGNTSEGLLSKILKGTPKRHQKSVLWVWLTLVFTLKGTFYLKRNDEHHHFYMGVPLPPLPQENTKT